MSYCRVSSMDFQCDLYVYHSTEDRWIIHVASQKRRISLEGLPEVPPFPETDKTTREEMLAWAEAQTSRQQEVYRRLEETEHTPIGLPHDGESFYFLSPGECADQCQKLIDMGYLAPDGLVSVLREEQAEIDENISTP